jgi:tetratricopeptide (TPR) repeat protein
MRRIWSATYLLVTFCGCIWGQNRADQQLERAFGLEQKGQFDQAVEMLRPLAGSQQLTLAEAGRARVLLGYAYQEESDFADARTSYEQAARLFRDEPSEKADYGTALDNLADWYRATGNLKAAQKLEKGSLKQYEQARDHAGAAWASMHLAVIELTRKQPLAAQRYLDETDKEAALAQNHGDDFSAALYSTKGWLAELEGQSSTAIFDYTQSLALRTCKTCMLTGWQYVLLGKAYANDGQLNAGLGNLREGLAILGSAPGPHSRRYLAAEMAYAQVLDTAGEHAESAALESSAKTELMVHEGQECSSCRQGLHRNW